MVSSSLVYHAGNDHPPRPNSRTQENRPKALVIAAIVATVLLWASAFPAIRVSLTAYTPAEVAFLRYLVASAVLIVYALINRMPIPRLRDLPLICVCGFIGFALYNFMLNAGQVTVPARGSKLYYLVGSGCNRATSVAIFWRTTRQRGLGWCCIVYCGCGCYFAQWKQWISTIYRGVAHFHCNPLDQLILGFAKAIVATIHSDSIYNLCDLGGNTIFVFLCASCSVVNSSRTDCPNVGSYLYGEWH